MLRVMRRVVLLLLGLVCVGLMRLLEPLYRVRIGCLWSNRIGHFAGNTEVYLCEVDAGMHPGGRFGGWTVWHYLNPTVCNRQLERMWKRVLRVWQFSRVVWLVNRQFAGWDRFGAEGTQLDRDVHNLYEKQAPHIGFTQQEVVEGEKGLRSMGIPEGSKWVCLIVRDSAYLGRGSEYHDYRDSSIQEYWLAAMDLTNRGYYVIRMGAKVAKPLVCANPKVIDYATNGMRSDFMDVYLLANCAFALSNGSGPDSVAVIFRRPVCYVNFAPVGYLFTMAKNTLAIWKHHERDGKRMTPAEIYASGAHLFQRAGDYTAAGITLTENSPQEIRDAALEMAFKIEGIGRRRNDVPLGIWNEESFRQKAFWKSYPRFMDPYSNKPVHGEIRMRIGRQFLASYERAPERLSA